MNRNKERDSIIIRTSWVGIIANFLLAGFKAFIGVTSHSVAIVTDAINNLSDAASSVITIAGTKLASKESDKKHPFGYGRIEYITSMVIAIIVMYAGLKAVTESVEEIIEPRTPEYSAAGLAVIVVAVIAILWKRHKGEEITNQTPPNPGYTEDPTETSSFYQETEEEQ